MSARSAVREYARTLSELTSGGRTAVTRFGTVLSHTATSVTVQIGADTLTAPFQAGYNPITNGDAVRVDFFGPSPIVVDRVVGVTVE